MRQSKYAKSLGLPTPMKCSSCGSKFIRLQCLLADGMCFTCWRARAEAAETKLAELRGNLKSIEHAGWNDIDGEYCVACLSEGRYHEADCWLAAALKGESDE